MSPQIKNSDFELCKYFRVASSHYINLLKYEENALCKANILKLHDLVSSSTAQTSEVCFAQ